MPVVFHGAKQIQAKVVYYGPGQSGKTTNLEQIDRRVQVTSRIDKGRLLKFAANSERKVFFDVLPLRAETIGGYQTMFQFFTVPGHRDDHQVRQLVLRDADGIVFVADSQYEAMASNVDSWADLLTNLSAMGRDPNDIPLVLQFNKQDLPNAAPRAYLEFLLNRRTSRVPSFVASASQGEGVFETLNCICRLLVWRHLRPELG